MHSSEDPTLLDSMPPTDEVLETALQELRLWKDGILPERALDDLQEGWPRVKDRVSQEWQRMLLDPTEENVNTMVPAVGLYISANSHEVDFLEILLAALQMEVETRSEVFGDILFMDGPSLMALMASENATGIRLLETAALPQDIEVVFNTMPLEALAVLVAEQKYERAAFDQLVRTCIAEYSAKETADFQSHLWRHQLLSILCDLGLGSFVDLIRGWFEEGLMREDEFEILPLVDRAGFEECAERQEGSSLETWSALENYLVIEEDVYAGMLWMSREKGFLQPNLEPFREPERAASPKIGRNTPCPCGSGKKYKKCCGNAAG